MLGWAAPVPLLGEAVGRILGQREQRGGDVAHVIDQAAALGPHGVGLGVKLAELALGVLGHRHRVRRGVRDAPVGLCLRAPGDLSRLLMGHLEDRARLLAHALELGLHRRLWVAIATHLQLSQLVLELGQVGVDRLTVVTVQRGGETLPALGRVRVPVNRVGHRRRLLGLLFLVLLPVNLVLVHRGTVEVVQTARQPVPEVGEPRAGRATLGLLIERHAASFEVAHP